MTPNRPSSWKLSRFFASVVLPDLRLVVQDHVQKRVTDCSRYHKLTMKASAVMLPYLRPLRKIEWVVYAKRPFGGPETVLAYLSRYTHRVAIANHRLIAADANTWSRLTWPALAVCHGRAPGMEHGGDADPGAQTAPGGTWPPAIQGFPVPRLLARLH
jgi:hypothetical protein